MTGERKAIGEQLLDASLLGEGVDRHDPAKVLAAAESMLSRPDSAVKPDVALQTKAMALYMLKRFDEAKQVLDQLGEMGVESPAITRMRWRIRGG